MLEMKYPNSVKWWLRIGLFMVFVQVVVGGITRLTESGLSITKWEVISGTLPPMTDKAWNDEFDLYKTTPQYKEINEGLSMSDFKFIYFWEYIHRFWARIMGFVFLLPFIYFYRKGYLDKPILVNLGYVIVLASLAAIFGWVMVASGLIERPWVNAYKLTFHLLIAFSVFTMLLWTYLVAFPIHSIKYGISVRLKSLVTAFTILVVVQIFFGGIISGMKAAVIYPSWPSMHGEFLPDVLLDISQWKMENFYNYDRNLFMPALIHFLHRNTGYLVLCLGVGIGIGILVFAKEVKSIYVKNIAISLIGILILQVSFGIITIISSVGSIPVLWGVLHQAGALLLLSIIIIIHFSFILKIK